MTHKNSILRVSPTLLAARRLVFTGQQNYLNRKIYLLDGQTRHVEFFSQLVNLPQYNSESSTLNISPSASFELTVLIIASLQGEMKLLSRYLNSAGLIARTREQKRNKCRYGYSVFFECAIWRANKTCHTTYK